MFYYYYLSCKMGTVSLGKRMMIKIIAEVGLAHMGRMDYAKRLIDAARRSGADAVKFQVYKTEELIHPDRDPVRFKRFKERELSYDDFAALKRYADDIGIRWFATPHTVGAFHFLVDLGVDWIKVGSGDRGEILELAVIWAKKEVRKRILLCSLGMRERDYAYEIAWDHETFNNFIPMHCITEYPVSPKNAQLSFLKDLGTVKGLFGYSDHTVGAIASCMAVALGAKYIEKHICLDESKGQDCLCSEKPINFPLFVDCVRKAESMMGERVLTKGEKENMKWALKSTDGLRPFSSLE